MRRIAWLGALVAALSASGVPVASQIAQPLQPRDPLDLLTNTHEWKIEGKHSELGNGGTAFASLDSDGTIPNVIGAPEHATFIIRCQGNEIVFFIAWPRFLGTGYANVKYKTNREVFTDSWPISDSGTAFGFWHGEPGLMTFLKNLSPNNMPDADRLVISAETPSAIAEEAVFHLKGMTAASHAIEDICAGH